MNDSPPPLKLAGVRQHCAELEALARLPAPASAATATGDRDLGPQGTSRADQDLPPLPRKAALERAEKLLIPETRHNGAPYPVEALGPLAEAAQALADGAQVDPAMAGQSVLAAAALLAQSQANVRSADGSMKPLSLYVLTVALSGDGKDTADRVALGPVHEWQRKKSKEHVAAQAEHEREAATRKRGEAPPERPPAAPYRTAADVTVEGLRRSFVEGVASQGVFSTEAGAIMAGHAMSAEHRIKTVATLCGLWDRGRLSVVRGGAPRVELYGLRLSMHLLAQPAALGDVLADEDVANVGFWPRNVMAWPAPLPPRVFRPWQPETSAPIGAYWRRCTELLQRAVPADCDALPAVELDAQALAGMGRFFESMERMAKLGELRTVRPFALRATELACRVAGVLAVFDGRHTIDAEAARRGCTLIEHSLENWCEARAGRADPVPGWALTMYRWLAERPEGAHLRDATKSAPMSVRPAARRDAALEHLQAVGLADVHGGCAVALGVSHEA